MSLLLALAGAVLPPEPPEEDEPFHAVGGKGVRRPASRSAALAAEAEYMELLIAQNRDEQDLCDLQDIVAALFAFKGIF